MASPLISQPVLPANPGEIRQLKRIKALILTNMRPKFDTIRSVTIGAIPVQSQTVHDLYGDYLELSHLVRNHPLFAAE
jgi:hypothetical protein